MRKQIHTSHLRCLGASALTILGLAFSVLPSAQAQSNNWPEKPIKLIVAYAPGGPTDLVARTVANGLQQQLKQAVVVDNRAGAGGTIGTGYVVNSAPDGYTLELGLQGPITINPALTKVSYDPFTDLVAVRMIATAPMVLMASKKSGITKLADVTTMSKSTPNGLNIGSSGIGSLPHVAAELLKHETGANIVHVPYKGAAPATAAVLGGEIAFALVGAPPLMAHIATGQLQALAVTQPERSPLLPAVPTVGEAIGIMADGDFVAWYGLLAPSHTPTEVVQQLEKAALAVLKRPEMRTKFTALGTELVAAPGAQFSERMRTESKLYGGIIKRFDIKAT